MMKNRFARMRRTTVPLIKKFQRDEGGATAIEYSLITAMIFLAVVGAIKHYVDTTSGLYSEIGHEIRNK